jgi:hypothetical protein
VLNASPTEYINAEHAMPTITTATSASANVKPRRYKKGRISFARDADSCFSDTL